MAEFLENSSRYRVLLALILSLTMWLRPSAGGANRRAVERAGLHLSSQPFALAKLVAYESGPEN